MRQCRRAENTPSLHREIVNLSDLNPQWRWLEPACKADDALSWQHFSSASVKVAPMLARGRSAWARASAARRALAAASRGSLLVTHGPWPALHLGMQRWIHDRPIDHLAYAFTFTRLPRGARHALMARAFRRIDRFVSFSSVERAMYARHFDLDIDRFDVHLWAARPPPVEPGGPRIAGDYISAVGSQGRDYSVLVAAMRKLPRLRLVIVADPSVMHGLSLPDNVELVNGVSLPVAMNIVQHSRAVAIALRDAGVPCGHSSIVAAMHLGKAIACTASSGVNEYITDRTGLSVAPADPQAWAHALERLESDDALRDRLGSAALAFASANCSESVAVEYLRGYLRGARHPGATPSARTAPPAGSSVMDSFSNHAPIPR